MPRNPPSHGKQILWTKHRPDEQMSSQRRTTSHNTRQQDTRKQRQHAHMAQPNILILAVIDLLLFLLSELVQVRVFPGHPVPFV